MRSEQVELEPVDLLVIGGGVNGCGIARDAAGRGLSIVLAEMDDLASATSSASTKLFHGGLRYLEYFEFRLVREALIERETLLRAMPHISWPMRFVLPYHPDMRFDSGTPTSRLLGAVMPWTRGRRPAWLIRLGLFLYDNLGGRKLLPGTTSVDLSETPEGAPLKPKFQRAYEYSDCWVEDSRLVVLNARDAEARGARILTRTKMVGAVRKDDHWQVELRDIEDGASRTVRARVLVNATGPWAAKLIETELPVETKDRVRLVRGSHIVTRRLYDHDKCYFFQGEDGRIIFAIPYENEFTLIGTTDREHDDPDLRAVCTPEEEDYLCTFASQYFRTPITREDVVWTYSGVRPLYNEGEGDATAATRDYILKVETSGAPLLNIFGGKITTYRRLAETAMDKLGRFFPNLPGPWTAGVPLPGGAFPVGAKQDLIFELRTSFPFVSQAWARRLVQAYGTEAWAVLGEADSREALGIDFGADLTEREVNWLMENEFARTAEDILWRRSKLGLHMSEAQRKALADWIGRSSGGRRVSG